MIPDKAQEVLDFWFGPEQDPAFGTQKKAWFIKSQDFDQTIRDRFLVEYEAALSGQLASWQNHPKSCLALIIVLDQFSRNLFRNTPQAFQADEQARHVAQHALSQGFEKELCPVECWFLFLPFEHSERLADQEISLALWATLQEDAASQSAIDYAKQHAEVIQKFGRFPHRNHILNRKNTSEETEFLKQPGSRF